MERFYHWVDIAWYHWAHLLDGVPYWDPHGATISLIGVLFVVGGAVKLVLEG